MDIPILCNGSQEQESLDKIYTLIFSHLPLQNLLSIRRVCRSWKELIEKDFAKRRSLKLFHDYHSVQSYCYQLINNGMDTHSTFMLHEPGKEDDDLVVTQPSKFNNDHDFVLAQLFPKVRHLVVFNPHPHPPPPHPPHLRHLVVFNTDLASHFRVPILLETWPQLISFAMFGQARFPQWKLIWKHLNRMKKLKRLHIFSIIEIRAPETYMPVMSKLSRFSLTGPYYKFKHPDHNLLGYVQIFEDLSSNLTHLNCIVAELNGMFSKESIQNVTHLTIDEPNQMIKDDDTMRKKVIAIQFICKHFTQLKYLNITDSSLKASFFCWFANLVKLIVFF